MRGLDICAGQKPHKLTLHNRAFISLLSNESLQHPEFGTPGHQEPRSQASDPIKQIVRSSNA